MAIPSYSIYSKIHPNFFTKFNLQKKESRLREGGGKSFHNPLSCKSVNELNHSIKRQRFINLEGKKSKFKYIWFTRDVENKMTQNENEEMRKLPWVEILISHKENFKHENITQNKDGHFIFIKSTSGDFPGGPESTCQCRGQGSIPDVGTKIPRAVGQLSPRATTTEPGLWSPTREARGLQLERPTGCSRVHKPQWRPRAAAPPKKVHR